MRIAVALTLLLSACNDASPAAPRADDDGPPEGDETPPFDDTPGPGAVIEPWGTPDETADEQRAWGRRLTRFFGGGIDRTARMSLWRSRYAAPAPGERLDRSRLGWYGVGNGAAFAFVGTSRPLNTVHALAGPFYQRRSRYFPDGVLAVERGADAVVFEREYIARVDRAPIVATRAETAAGLEFATFTVAPLWAFSPQPAVVQYFSLTNDGSAPVDDLRLVFSLAASDGRDDTAPDPCLGDDAGDSRLRVCADGFGRADGRLVRGPFALSPGQSVEGAVIFAAADDGPDVQARLDAVIAAVRARGRGALADATSRYWTEKHRGTFALETPDNPRIGDLVSTQLVVVLAQQAANGAIVPMSYYTSAWLRDTYGAVRFLARTGRSDDAARALDYLYAAHAVGGGIANSRPADLDVSAPPAVDWAAKVPFSGRTAAEGPSHLPAAYHALFKAGEPTAVACARWAYLRSAVDGQVPDERGRLPFSGDETYRAAMGIGLGLGADFAWEEKAFSAGSGFWLVAALRALADLAAPCRRAPEEAAELRTRAERLMQQIRDVYYVPETKHYGSFQFRDRPTADPACFEDVSTLPLWLDLWPTDSADAVDHFSTCNAQIGRTNGLWGRTPPAGGIPIGGFDITQGVFTGMAPGLVLSAAARLDAPLQWAILSTMGRTADPAGSFAEDHLHADLRPLMPFYFTNGSRGEQWARWRFWEGAINAEAILDVFVGRGYDARTGALHLSPAMPDDWTRYNAKSIPAGAARVDLYVARYGGADPFVDYEVLAPDTVRTAFEVRAQGRPVRSIEVRAGEEPTAEVFTRLTGPFARTADKRTLVLLPVRTGRFVVRVR